MSESKQEFSLDDGRKAEKRITEIDGKIITELFVEPKIEKKLSQRTIEYKADLVYKREIEKLNDAGEVVEKELQEARSLELEPETHQDQPQYVTKDQIDRSIADGLLLAVAAVRANHDALKKEDDTPTNEVSSLSLLEQSIKAKSDIGGILLWVVTGLVASAFVYAVFNFFKT